MGAAAHAGVVGADDFFALEFHGGFFHVHVLVDELDEVEFDGDLVLSSRDDDFAFFNYSFVVHFELVVERAAGRFDESDADAGLGDDFLRRFGLEGLLFQEVDRLVYGVKDFDGLGEIIVENVVGRKQRKCFCGVVLGARMETGAVDVEPSDCADAIGFAVEGVGGGLGIGEDDVLQMIAIARFIDDESLHVPQIAFEIGEFTVSEGGIVAFSDER